MTSANKSYKESKSSLPFKEWLKREQIKGNLKVHDTFVNANGSQEDTKSAPEKTCESSCTPMWIPALVGIAIGSAAVYVLLKKKAASDS